MGLSVLASRGVQNICLCRTSRECTLADPGAWASPNRNSWLTVDSPTIWGEASVSGVVPASGVTSTVMRLVRLRDSPTRDELRVSLVMSADLEAFGELGESSGGGWGFEEGSLFFIVVVMLSKLNFQGKEKLENEEPRCR